MHRHIKAGDRGQAFVNGALVEGSVIELMGNELISFRADIGPYYSIRLHDFLPDYKTEQTQMVESKKVCSRKDAINSDQRESWIRDNAYFRWLNAGCPHAQEVRLWCEAEHAFDALG